MVIVQELGKKVYIQRWNEAEHRFDVDTREDYDDGRPRKSFTRLTRRQENRFRRNVRVSPRCWRWQGSKAAHGYGVTTIGQGRQVMAHQLAYFQWRGPIYEYHHIHHICGTRDCVRVSHLEQLSETDHRVKHTGPFTGKAKT